MVTVQLEDIFLVGAVSLLAAWQLATFAKRVGKYRMQHKIPYPSMTGDEDFMRYLRAQQNTLEFFPIFLTTLWMSCLFFHQGPAAAAGLVYVYARYKYFNGYIKSVQDRLPGFKLGVKCLMVLLLTASLGILTTLLRQYMGLDLKLLAVGKIQPFFPAISKMV